ncbi:coiled-coil domain-containing protein 181 [Osmerus mordax]|uniref:coiled-coil domain-containing protein 181 n=1 Tax=Osmerus mordax TaxID=8014 RepID=UPI00350F445A
MSTRTQEEYEDDFEKDLDWLIGEDARSENQEPDDEDIEAQIDKELEEEEGEQGKESKKSQKEKNRGEETEEAEVEERWPSPMEPLEFDSDRESQYKLSSIAPPPLVPEDQLDDEKKYILEKIEQANRELQDQEAPDMTRQRRLHFKETLVDLVVPPVDFEVSGFSQSTGVEVRKDCLVGGTDTKIETEVAGRLSELKISQRDGAGEGSSLAGDPGQTRPEKRVQAGQEKEGIVLVEKDGKFDLVSLKEVESLSLLPPIANGLADNPRSDPCPGGPRLSPNKAVMSSLHSQGIEHLRAPRPPAKPRNRPSSASHTEKGRLGRGTKRRVQSANGTPTHVTYTLSPEQKEILQKMQERKGRQAREAEQRRCEEEQQKRQENEIAFRAWLLRKRGQVQEERRIHQAQEMERMNGRRESCDPDEAFRAWLRRKQGQQLRERQLEEMKKMEQESGFYLHNREECERAFKLWLKRKRLEKRAEQRAAREHARRLVLEERRARRLQDLLCSANEPLRFTEHLAYRF